MTEARAPHADAVEMIPRSRQLMLAVVLSAAFMEIIDSTIVNVAIPSIQRDLSASVSAIEFIVAGYLLAFAVTLITGGRLGDIYGRRKVFMLGMAGFTLASLACAAAPSAGGLVGARVVQGLFAGMMFPQVLSIIQVAYKPEERAGVLGIYGVTLGMATILGPLLGGSLIAIFSSSGGWRSVFFINVPIGLFALLVARKHLPESKATGAAGLDPIGVGIITVGLLLLIYPLVEGRTYDWPWWAFAMLAASVPVLLAFVLFEQARGRNGRPQLVPLRLFRQRAFSLGLALNLFFFLGVIPFFFTVIFFLQVGNGFSALGAGLLLVPFALGASATSAPSGLIAAKLGKWVLALGCVVMAAGMGLLSLSIHLAGPGVHGYQLVPALFICGLGMGLFVAPVTAVVLAGIGLEDAGSASGVLATMQEFAGAAGIAIVGVIFFGLLGTNAANATAEVAPALRSDLIAQGVPAGEADGIVAGFRTCFHDRATAKDPSETPASCPPEDSAAAGSVEQAITERALPRATRIDFSRTMTFTLLFEVLAFVLALLCVFLLPKVDPARIEEVSLEGH
jgi:EmrB/QacA subfamily drug resistance transporter